jgi:hypothetical protein
MGAVLSPRVDSSSKSTLKPCADRDDQRIAQADGLPESDALSLATWLRSAGYDSIEVINFGDHSTVLWRK